MVDPEGETADAWPELDSNQVLPPGLEITIDVEPIGQIRRVYAMTDLPQSLPGGFGQGRDQESDEGEDDSLRPGVPLGAGLRDVPGGRE